MCVIVRRSKTYAPHIFFYKFQQPCRTYSSDCESKPANATTANAISSFPTSTNEHASCSYCYSRSTHDRDPTYRTVACVWLAPGDTDSSAWLIDSVSHRWHGYSILESECAEWVLATKFRRCSIYLDLYSNTPPAAYHKPFCGKTEYLQHLRSPLHVG